MHTNIVNFSVVREGLSAPWLEKRMVEEGVLFHALDEREMRMVTHRDVSRDDIEYALERMAAVLRAIGGRLQLTWSARRLYRVR